MTDSISQFTLEEEEQYVREDSINFMKYTNDYNVFAAKGDEYHDLLCNSACKSKILKDKGELLYVLDMIRLDKEWHLGIRLADSNEEDDVSDFYLFDESGQQTRSIFEHLSVQPSKMGFWQVYLLLTSYSVMPQNEQNENLCRDYIFGVNDLKDISALSILDLSELQRQGVVSPEVILRLDDNGRHIADVSCTYWNKSLGLVREHIRIVVDNSRVVSVEKSSSTLS